MPKKNQIIHLDMDSFYASVELARNPQWRNMPVVIGRYVENTGIVTTANYIARKHGIKSAMPMFKALKLCENLIIIPPDMQAYKRVSKIISEQLYKFSQNIEFIALDEAYIDISDKNISFEQAITMLQQMRAAIFAATNLHCSAGLASNKILAKIASEYNKPNGEFYIRPEQEQEFIDKLELKKINGVGKKLAEQLANNNIFTCLDLKQVDFNQVSIKNNKFINKLVDFANGKNIEISTKTPSRKSISYEKSLLQPITSLEQCIRVLKLMYVELNTRFAKLENNEIKSIFIKIKYANLTQITRERQLQTSNSADVQEFIHLIEAVWNQAPVKLLGLGYRL